MLLLLRTYYITVRFNRRGALPVTRKDYPDGQIKCTSARRLASKDHQMMDTIGGNMDRKTSLQPSIQGTMAVTTTKKGSTSSAVLEDNGNPWIEVVRKGQKSPSKEKGTEVLSVWDRIESVRSPQGRLLKIEQKSFDIYRVRNGRSEMIEVKKWKQGLVSQVSMSIEGAKWLVKILEKEAKVTREKMWFWRSRERNDCLVACRRSNAGGQYIMVSLPNTKVGGVNSFCFIPGKPDCSGWALFASTLVEVIASGRTGSKDLNKLCCMGVWKVGMVEIKLSPWWFGANEVAAPVKLNPDFWIAVKVGPTMPHKHLAFVLGLKEVRDDDVEAKGDMMDTNSLGALNADTVICQNQADKNRRRDGSGTYLVEYEIDSNRAINVQIEREDNLNFQSEANGRQEAMKIGVVGRGLMVAIAHVDVLDTTAQTIEIVPNKTEKTLNPLVVDMGPIQNQRRGPNFSVSQSTKEGSPQEIQESHSIQSIQKEPVNKDIVTDSDQQEKMGDQVLTTGKEIVVRGLPEGNSKEDLMEIYKHYKGLIEDFKAASPTLGVMILEDKEMITRLMAEAVRMNPLAFVAEMETIGASGGVLMLWSKDSLEVEDVWVKDVLITSRCKSRADGFKWMITGLYGPNDDGAYVQMWDKLNRVRSNYVGP
ncbi:hypothetical protein BVC80_7221g2 [Macleaya cordata]|uniref:Uncharacterized protein n=1 Tax=Macleaya cordata TaxID=56857 RepID=A0A200Q449_MACCD|nr:hypothetical protein BVC80_7221g2 [Macleaya cordata]